MSSNYERAGAGRDNEDGRGALPPRDKGGGGDVGGGSPTGREGSSSPRGREEAGSASGGEEGVEHEHGGEHDNGDVTPPPPPAPSSNGDTLGVEPEGSPQVSEMSNGVGVGPIDITPLPGAGGGRNNLTRAGQHSYPIPKGESCTVKVGDKIRVIHGPAILNFASSDGLMTSVLGDEDEARRAGGGGGGSSGGTGVGARPPSGSASPTVINVTDVRPCSSHNSEGVEGGSSFILNLNEDNSLVVCGGGGSGGGTPMLTEEDLEDESATPTLEHAIASPPTSDESLSEERTRTDSKKKGSGSSSSGSGCGRDLGSELTVDVTSPVKSGSGSSGAGIVCSGRSCDSPVGSEKSHDSSYSSSSSSFNPKTTTPPESHSPVISNNAPSSTSNTTPATPVSTTSTTNPATTTRRRNRPKVKMVAYQDNNAPEYTEKIRSALSSIKPPVLSRVEAREAEVMWQRCDVGGVPQALSSGQDLSQKITYTLNFGHRNEKRPIPCGSELSHVLGDLSPGQHYEVSVTACFEEKGMKGTPSGGLSFSTRTLPPSKPAPPTCKSKTKSSLQLTWPNVQDNGAKLQFYRVFLIENNVDYDVDELLGVSSNSGGGGSGSGSSEGKSGTGGGGVGGPPCVAVAKAWLKYEGLAKTAKIDHLRASTVYKVRLIAKNSVGFSEASEEVKMSTSAAPPPQPGPPTLVQRDTSSIKLSWHGYLAKHSFPAHLPPPNFVLEMEDKQKGYGFITQYHGPDSIYTISNLPRNSKFNFRLSVELGEDNGQGQGANKSRPSEALSVQTLACAPQPPTGLRCSSVNTTKCDLEWEEPGDSGGAKVTGYIVERSVSGGVFKEIYEGDETRFSVHSLFPGTEYNFRVAAVNSAGKGKFSSNCPVKLKPVGPNQVNLPWVSGRPKPHSLHLCWAAPDYDGGSPILEYAVQQIPSAAMSSDEDVDGCVAEGTEISRDIRTDLIVFQLAPGTKHWFKVCAVNSVGRGPWSPALEVKTAADKPSAPDAPRVVFKSPTHARISWFPPKYENGSPIKEYRLECCEISKYNNAGSGSNPGSGSPTTATANLPVQSSIGATPSPPPPPPLTPSNGATHSKNNPSGGVTHHNQASSSSKSSLVHQYPPHSYPDYFQIWHGGASRLQFDYKNVKPATDYKFRVQAINDVGSSAFSVETCITSPCSSPGTITHVNYEPGTDTIAVSWQPPAPNGAPIESYNIECCSPSASLPVHSGLDDSNAMYFVTNMPSYTISGLRPDHVYKIRVQAVNANGCANFSTWAKVQTMCLPPEPPSLECVSATATSLRLKWGDVSSPNSSHSAAAAHSHPHHSSSRQPITYHLQIEDKSNRFQVVYSGPGMSYKVIRLAELTTYTFRMNATNEAGTGPYSQLYCFTTTKSPPPTMKAPRVQFVRDKTAEVSWVGVPGYPGGEDTVLYQLAIMQPSTSSEYSIVYKGEETCFKLSGLMERADYRLKVCGVRQCGSADDNQEIAGQYSPITSFHTLDRHQAAAAAANLLSSGAGAGPGAVSLHGAGGAANGGPTDALLLDASSNLAASQGTGSFLARLFRKLFRMLAAMKDFQLSDFQIQILVLCVFVGLAFAIIYYFVSVGNY